MAAVNHTNLRENVLTEFDKAVTEALKAGLSPDELKQRIDEVDADGKL